MVSAIETTVAEGPDRSAVKVGRDDLKVEPHEPQMLADRNDPNDHPPIQMTSTRKPLRVRIDHLVDRAPSDHAVNDRLVARTRVALSVLRDRSRRP